MSTRTPQKLHWYNILRLLIQEDMHPLNNRYPLQYYLAEEVLSAFVISPEKMACSFPQPASCEESLTQTFYPDKPPCLYVGTFIPFLWCDMNRERETLCKPAMVFKLDNPFPGFKPPREGL